MGKVKISKNVNHIKGKTEKKKERKKERNKIKSWWVKIS